MKEPDVLRVLLAPLPRDGALEQQGVKIQWQNEQLLWRTDAVIATLHGRDLVAMQLSRALRERKGWWRRGVEHIFQVEIRTSSGLRLRLIATVSDAKSLDGLPFLESTGHEVSWDPLCSMVKHLRALGVEVSSWDEADATLPESEIIRRAALRREADAARSKASGTKKTKKPKKAKRKAKDKTKPTFSAVSSFVGWLRDKTKGFVLVGGVFIAFFVFVFWLAFGLLESTTGAIQSVHRMPNQPNHALIITHARNDEQRNTRLITLHLPSGSVVDERNFETRFLGSRETAKVLKIDTNNVWMCGFRRGLVIWRLSDWETVYDQSKIVARFPELQEAGMDKAKWIDCDHFDGTHLWSKGRDGRWYAFGPDLDEPLSGERPDQVISRPKACESGLRSHFAYKGVQFYTPGSTRGFLRHGFQGGDEFGTQTWLDASFLLNAAGCGPLIHQGNMFVAHRKTLDDDERRLAMVDVKSGAAKWHVSLEVGLLGRVWKGGLIEGDVLVLLFSNFDTSDPAVVGLSLKTGRVLWGHDL